MGSAFKPEPKAPVTKTYRVAGDRPFRGYDPGDQLELTEDEASRYVQRGTLEEIGGFKVKETKSSGEKTNGDGDADASEE